VRHDEAVTAVDMSVGGVWPELRLAEWQGTRDTLQLLTQIVGKVRMESTPLMNHWWNVPLYVTARGLTTSLIPRADRAFQIDFDFVDQRLDISVSDGTSATVPLVARTVADFYAEFTVRLDGLGLATPIWTMPVEIPDAIPFDRDIQHATYDGGQAKQFWLALVEMNRVFEVFRSRFIGKVSPVHLFWGALDLAVTRFSGRPAPAHPGGAPNCGPQVMHEAYSHEVSSAGYWPGPDGEGIFYSYAYPIPEGFAGADLDVPGARYDPELGEFTLPYEAVRTALDPDKLLLAFLQASYDIAADLARWDRAALERPH
jgi:Family of unknown function (DUF5996)